MARCDYCGSTILFGGISENEMRFCSDKCYQLGVFISIAEQVPEDILSQEIMDVHQGSCPKCGGPGPIDIHTYYVAMSALLFTVSENRPQICCRGCGLKSKLGGALWTSVAGWWGIPWGFIYTPIQVTRNIIGIFSSPDPTKPSAELEKHVKINIAVRIFEASNDNQTTA